MQVHYMRNPPTMLKIFNPELYMDPNNSRTWKIVAGSWIIVATTLGLMYLRDTIYKEKEDVDMMRAQKRRELETQQSNEVNEKW